MSDFYSATIFLSVFIMIIMDMLVSGNDLMEHDKKQTVYTISVLVIACMVSEWFGVWMDGSHPSLRTLHILVKTIELSTAPIITVLCSDLMTPLKHKKLIYTLIGVHAGLEVLSAFFGFIFSVDAQNVYHHETFYWVYVLAYASGVLLFIGQLLSESSHHYGLYPAGLFLLWAVPPVRSRSAHHVGVLSGRCSDGLHPVFRAHAENRHADSSSEPPQL